MQKRVVLWWLLLFMLVCNTFVTLNINIAIVSMVNTQRVEITSNTSQTFVCPKTTFLPGQYSKSDVEVSSNSVSENTGYAWSETEQNMVLSGYYWINYFSILPGGILAHKYGSKRVVGYAQFISSAMSSLIPIVAGYGPLAVSCIRAVQGLLSFMSVPAGLYSIMGNWSPPHERARFGSNFTIGSCIGMLVGSFLFGFIGQYLHWTYIFHLTSVCGIIWSVFWYLLAYDSPARHPSISIREKDYIESSLKASNSNAKAFIPWEGILTSVPLLVCVMAVSSSTWGWVATTTYSPKYLNSFYGLNSNEIGIITSVPNLVVGLLSVGLAQCSDMVIEKKLLTMTAIRKIFTLIGGILSNIPLLIISFTKCDLILAISCLMINALLRGFSMFGVALVVMDLSPKFCGILEGFTGSTASILAFVFSAMVNYFTAVYDTEALWKMVFLYTAIFCVFSNGMFLIFGTSEVQNWNFDDDAEKDQQLKETSRLDILIVPNQAVR